MAIRPQPMGWPFGLRRSCQKHSKNCSSCPFLPNIISTNRAFVLTRHIRPFLLLHHESLHYPPPAPLYALPDPCPNLFLLLPDIDLRRTHVERHSDQRRPLGRDTPDLHRQLCIRGHPGRGGHDPSRRGGRGRILVRGTDLQLDHRAVAISWPQLGVGRRTLPTRCLWSSRGR